MWYWGGKKFQRLPQQRNFINFIWRQWDDPLLTERCMYSPHLEGTTPSDARQPFMEKLCQQLDGWWSEKRKCRYQLVYWSPTEANSRTINDCACEKCDRWLDPIIFCNHSLLCFNWLKSTSFLEGRFHACTVMEFLVQNKMILWGFLNSQLCMSWKEGLSVIINNIFQAL